MAGSARPHGPQPPWPDETPGAREKPHRISTAEITGREEVSLTDTLCCSLVGPSTAKISIVNLWLPRGLRHIAVDDTAAKQRNVSEA
jgi:hypothetical protein